MTRTNRGRDFDHAIDTTAGREFADRYGEPNLGPICVLIAAYREAQTLGKVLDAVPTEAHELPLSILVVDDGSDDGTANVAEAHGAYACRPNTNRGQGAALRLGYRLAAQYGAKYIVTTDADGQYDAGEIPALLTPIIDGCADFVSGSRRLGSTYQGDIFRHLGVIFYASLLRLLTRQQITDPSFGLRAMRVEVPASIDLRQAQFQASELLVGAAMRGYRLAEIPATMHRRAAGHSRKGNDLLYGAHFGWVVLSTWWRERDHRPQR
jgi:glycosyltransferase involved in cell wall biosynthesis